MTDPGPKRWIWHGEILDPDPANRPRSVLVQFKPPDRFDVHYCGRRQIVMWPSRAPGAGYTTNCRCKPEDCPHIVAVRKALVQRELDERDRQLTRRILQYATRRKGSV